MITGYNTDVEHNGVVYHVQTEDKGLETPVLLSLVYSGGAILASKRSSYQDLIDEGFDDSMLAERLQRQHRLICAAINAGRIEDLKRMSPAGGRTGQTGPLATPVPLESSLEQHVSAELEPYVPAQSVTPEMEPSQAPTEGHVEDLPEAIIEPQVAAPSPPSSPTQQKPSRPSPYTVYDQRRSATPPSTAPKEAGLRIVLRGERDYWGGDALDVELAVTRVSSSGEEPVAAGVSVKILGTAFRPVILTLKTGRDGIVKVKARIPSFKTGRAAIVIKASAAGLTSETRRVIHPG